MTGYTEPAEMDDPELYREYQHAKQNGPTLRIDELQKEIAERWESETEKTTTQKLDELIEQRPAKLRQWAEQRDDVELELL